MFLQDRNWFIVATHRSSLHTQSIGVFLCRHSPEPPIEDITRLPWQDIKQDACLRAIVALKRAGKPIGPDPIAAFNAEPRLVITAYQRARRDALRYHLGRGHDSTGARWRRLVSLDQGLIEIADPAQGEAMEDVFNQIVAYAHVVRLWRTGWGGIKPATMRKLIRALIKVQRLRAEGITTVPPHIRQQLHDLRRFTKLPISTIRLF